MSNLGFCTCSDPQCPEHLMVPGCRAKATTVLYRVDMQYETGSPMCGSCAHDAPGSGLFDLVFQDDHDDMAEDEIEEE